MSNSSMSGRLILTPLLVIIWTAFAWANETEVQTTNKEFMYSIFVTIHVQPDHFDTVMQATMEIAEASVAEPGCFRYEVLRDRQNPTVLYIFEVFRDKEAHSWHTQTEHFKAWWKTSAHLLDGKMKVVSMNTLFPSVDGYKSQKTGLLDR